MALADVLFTGTYTVVNTIEYSKQEKKVRFTLQVYRDSTKSIPVTAFTYAGNWEMSYPAYATVDENTPVGTVWCTGDSKHYTHNGTTWVETSIIDANNYAQYFSVENIGGTGKDILKSCYQYAKTLPEFSGAQDV